MRIGFVQMAPKLGDETANITKIDHLLADIDIPELLVLPELCNSGYNFANAGQARELATTVENSTFLAHLGEITRRRGCHIVTGFNELDNGLLYNSAVLLGPGGIVGKYRKLHLFLNEKDYFQPGNLGLPVFDLGCCRIGLMICFDWIFPEAWRVLALKGADIICHPSNLILPSLAQNGVQVHAVINRMFVILANRVGVERNLEFTGCSRIVDPRGKLLCQALKHEEMVVMTEIDIAQARDKQVTPRNHVLADRRPEEYQLLTEVMPTSEEG